MAKLRMRLKCEYALTYHAEMLHFEVASQHQDEMNQHQRRE